MEDQEEEDLREYIKKILKEEELIESKEKTLRKILPDYKIRDKSWVYEKYFTLETAEPTPEEHILQQKEEDLFKPFEEVPLPVEISAHKREDKKKEFHVRGHGLRNYIIKRLLMAVPVLLVISFIAFMLIYYSPGDAIDRMMGLEQVFAARGGGGMDVEYLLHLKHIFGLDQPWYIQYFQWLKQFAQGNFGLSFTTGRPVIEELMIRLPCTLSYQIVALILSVAIAIPAGVISALKRNTRTDTYIVMGSLCGASFPPFVTGLLLILLFSLVLGWLPSGGTHSWQLMGSTVPHDLSYYLDYLKHMILPTLTLTVVNIGYLTRMVRSSMLNVLTEDYVIAARSRGLKERVVIYKHALKNAMLPVMTVIGLRVAFMISGAPVIEKIFSWPGLGNYFVRAVQTRDYFSVVGASIMLGVIILVANLVIDLSYKWLDPRVEM